jgi:hypothetical protein
MAYFLIFLFSILTITYLFFNLKVKVFKCCWKLSAFQNLYSAYVVFSVKFRRNFTVFRGAGATGAAGATSPVAQTLRGQHGGNRLPFLPELRLEICALFTGIGV